MDCQCQNPIARSFFLTARQASFQPTGLASKTLGGGFGLVG